jgi:TonB family protein
MFERCPDIKRFLIVTMLCCLAGEILPPRARGQAINSKPTEQPSDDLTIDLITSTEGVNFSTYLTHLTPMVKRSWYMAMPESALMGQKGLVIVRVVVLRDGTLLDHTPTLVRTSGMEPLDKAALDAIRSSVPFEKLPAAFRGPNAELRFTFIYNIRSAPKQRSTPIIPEILKKPGLVYAKAGAAVPTSAMISR